MGHHILDILFGSNHSGILLLDRALSRSILCPEGSPLKKKRKKKSETAVMVQLLDRWCLWLNTNINNYFWDIKIFSHPFVSWLMSVYLLLPLAFTFSRDPLSWRPLWAVSRQLHNSVFAYKDFINCISLYTCVAVIITSRWLFAWLVLFICKIAHLNNLFCFMCVRDISTVISICDRSMQYMIVVMGSLSLLFGDCVYSDMGQKVRLMAEMCILLH